MASSTRICLGCQSPLPGGKRYCTACGAEASLADTRIPSQARDDPPLELERVRGALAGRYAIDREIGAGGTAVVYLAEDLRHRRKVAVKVLRPELAALVGPARFLREIEIAARLQHPHILPVYDSGEAAFGDDEGPTLLFYVMPFAGESLGARLARGEVPLGHAVRILSEVADGLAFAHAQGVVHRDVKPDNVMLSGRHAMVADFGIAKALTMTLGNRPRTGPGVPVGTPYYMSPEQVVGDPEVDGRADQYALGVVAYELLTGRRPFVGGTIHEVLAAQVLGAPERVDRLRPALPTALVQVVMRCLEKEPGCRWATTEELAARLEAVAQALGSITPPEAVLAVAARGLRPRMLGGLLTVGGAAAGLAIATALSRHPTRPLAVPMSDQVSFSGAIGISAISPDGRFLVYASREQGTLLLQELGGGPALEIARGLTHVLALRWSPDGTRILAGGRYEGDPGVYVLPRLGGPVERVGHGRLGQWHPAGDRVSLWDFPDKSLLTVDLPSGSTTTLALPGTYDWLYDAEWSPSGTRLAYVTAGEPNRYALRVVAAGGRGARVLLQDSVPIGSPRWAPREDALYYLRGGGELRKLRLDRSGAAARDGPQTLLDGLQASAGEVAGTLVPFTMTKDGRRLIYLKSVDYSNLWLLAGDPTAPGAFSTTQLTHGTALRRGVALSPDGEWIAYLESTREGTDVFRMPLDGGTAQRLTFNGRVASRGPAWSPDGNELAFGIQDGGAVRLQTIAARGGSARLFREADLPALGDVAWAPWRLILHQVSGNRNFHLLDPASGAGRWLVPESASGWIFAARPSPDGEHVAVYWNRRPLGGLWLVSLRDTAPVLLRPGRLDPIGWSADGRSILAVAWDSGGIVRLGLDGRTVAMGTLPFRDADCAAASRGRGKLVCVVPEQVSDVWMVAGFDPER